MELPTYTNIWKIEKRLYKLYDFRLPMPVPVGQVAAFLGIAVPYTLVLTMAGMPFSHTWFWVYVLPPGVLAWLVTRPVLEGKRLPELVLSQLRYLGEPRTWCRMAPAAEKDQITVVATVWHRSAPRGVTAGEPVSAPARSVVATVGTPAATEDRESRATKPVPAPATGHREATGPDPAVDGPPAAERQQVQPQTGAGAVRARAVSRTQPDSAHGGDNADITVADGALSVGEWAAASDLTATASGDVADNDSGGLASRPLWPDRPAVSQGPVVSEGPAVSREPAVSQSQAASAPGQTTEQGGPEAAQLPGPASSRTAGDAKPAGKLASPRSARPVVRVSGDTSAQPLHVVERALRNAPGSRADGWRDHVVVVPGGHRPGKPDQVQRDLARVRLPLAGPARIVVLGCTSGAGQTSITLVTGQLLTSLRGEPVAVLDLSPGPGSLTERARGVPRLLPNHRPGGASASASLSRAKGLQVVTASSPAEEPGDPGRLIDAVVARYPITLADPAPAFVPRSLQAADQLVLVAPASADAAGSLAMTLEWLEAHGHLGLVSSAVTVLNGVSGQTNQHVDRAAAVVAGRSRAVVRIPWDGRLGVGGPIGTAAVQAYTALAGLLIATLSGLPDAAVPAGASR